MENVTLSFVGGELSTKQMGVSGDSDHKHILTERRVTPFGIVSETVGIVSGMGQRGAEAVRHLLCHKMALVSLFKEKGCLVFRDFEFSREDFLALSNGFCHSTVVDPLGAVPRPRHDREATLLGVTAPDATIGITHHREVGFGCFSFPPPTMLFFFCERPAQSGGATLVVDGLELANALPENVREVLNGGVRYGRTLDLSAWAKLLRLDSSEKADQFLKANAQFYERHGEWVTVHEVMPVYVETAYGGNKAFANSIVLIDSAQKLAEDSDAIKKLKRRGQFTVSLPDGRPIPEEIICQLLNLTAEHQFSVDWEPGDFAWIDNTRYMHGRQAFSDTGRQVYIRMAYDIYR